MPPRKRSRMKTRIRAFTRRVSRAYSARLGVDPIAREESLRLLANAPQTVARVRRKIELFMRREHPRHLENMESAQKTVADLRYEQYILETAVGIAGDAGKSANGLHARLLEIKRELPPAEDALGYFQAMDALYRQYYFRPYAVKEALLSVGIPLRNRGDYPVLSELSRTIVDVFGPAVIVNLPHIMKRDPRALEPIKKVTGARMTAFLRNYFVISRNVLDTRPTRSARGP